MGGVTAQSCSVPTPTTGEAARPPHGAAFSPTGPPRCAGPNVRRCAAAGPPGRRPSDLGRVSGNGRPNAGLGEPSPRGRAGAANGRRRDRGRAGPRHTDRLRERPRGLVPVRAARRELSWALAASFSAPSRLCAGSRSQGRGLCRGYTQATPRCKEEPEWQHSPGIAWSSTFRWRSGF